MASAVPFDPSQPSIPISYPIKTLEELASRAYFNSFHYPFNKSSFPLQASGLDQQRPRMLVCHDMQGGYVDDKWVQGGDNENAYAIWHWYLIDVFVYFSHSLVTLPPPSWTNTAHRHGVKVLGTFITEGGPGRDICDVLLATKESARMYADRLAELAVALGFDGWLLNMEISLDLEQIPNLKEFVSHLTQAMHSSLPGSLVIWYDSVTVDGELIWQDQLNDKNKPFFDISDGIFVNYTWKEDYPKLSAAVAGDRKFDVYMGIDVFGRGTFGGGQWNTNAALDVLKKDSVSAALFAPGWVYETKQPPDFPTAQNQWWSLVENSWGIVNLYPKTLPFYSNFDQGHGYHISVEGQQVSNAPWNNLSSQGLQPFLEFNANPAPNTIRAQLDSKEASYNGGGNITFKGKLTKDAQFSVGLFRGELVLHTSTLYISISVKSEGNSLLGLSLTFTSNLNEQKSVLVASREANYFSSKFSEVIIPHHVNKIATAPGWTIEESSIELSLTGPGSFVLTEIQALCYKPEPQLNFLTDFTAILGHITLKSSKESSSFPPSDSWLVEGKHIKWSSSLGLKMVSAEIIWKLKEETDSSKYPKYNIYVEEIAREGLENPDGRMEGIKKYLGVANVEAFYISELPIFSSTSSLIFRIQVCGADGARQKLDDSPYFQLSVENK